MLEPINEEQKTKIIEKYTLGHTMRETTKLVWPRKEHETRYDWYLRYAPKARQLKKFLIAQNIPIEATDFIALIKFAKRNNIDLTIVGPDDPLALGIVDEFQKAGLKMMKRGCTVNIYKEKDIDYSELKEYEYGFKIKEIDHIPQDTVFIVSDTVETIKEYPYFVLRPLI